MMPDSTRGVCGRPASLRPAAGRNRRGVIGVRTPPHLNIRYACVISAVAILRTEHCSRSAASPCQSFSNDVPACSPPIRWTFCPWTDWSVPTKSSGAGSERLRRRSAAGKKY